jgi:hypothetical protein
MDLILAQLSDPFRIGLIFFLLVTALRTRAAMGMAMPLAAGVVFIAALIPLTTGAGAAMDGTARLQAIAFGVVSNAIILAIFLAGWTVWQRLRG